WVPFEALDSAVVPKILRAFRLSPTLAHARGVIHAYNTSQADTECTQRAQLQRAENEVLDYKKRYLAVDLANLEVKAELEAELQRALRTRDQLRGAGSAKQS